ncbi:spore gernimation protein [Sporosarcina sp. P37]|uniref:endospore germination permease n=1 Tax=unclassified Sporosarcina TaxID=2647733 RepID=UPI000A17B09C|nr:MULTISPECIES: endospore germination permease [unclassified Sporosarcina]ARK24707.1 spore gernimation protein [Sporosarcina sp. P37]PID19864.1 spore gernimation protein [Sporosarcina sp. P35]
MTKTGSISVLHVIFLSMTMIGLKNHVTIIPSLVKGAGRDGWISILVAVVAIFPWLLLVLYIHKKSNRQPMTEWLEETIGKVAAAVIRYVTAFFLLVLAAFTMGETLLWIVSTFLPKTPVLPLIIIYTVLCILFATANLQTIAMVNVIILFWITILGFFIAFTNMQVKNYELLQPFFEHGFQPVLATAVFPASGFVEILLFLFIQQQVKDQFRWYHFAVMLFILMGLTMGPTIGAITEFGPAEVVKQRFPAYEEWGIGSVGRFIEHFDFASIYQWLSGAFIRVSLLLFIAADLLKMRGDKQRIWKILAPAFFFMTLSLSLLGDRLFHIIKGDYLLIITFFFMLFLSLFLVIIALISGKSPKKIKT